MKIGIDIDEVVVEFMNGFLEHYNSKFGKSFRKEDIFVYDLEIPLGVGTEEAKKMVLEFYDSPGFENLNLVYGINENLSKLSKKNEIFFITSRPEEIKDKTLGYFKNNFSIKNFKIFFSGDTYGKNKSKSEICEDLGIEVMIEDNPYCAFDCARKGVRTFLIDKPWNKNFKNHENLMKVKDWGEVIGVLETGNLI